MVHIPRQKRKKLNIKATKCVFVGYSTQKKGWIFYDPVKNIFSTNLNANFFDEGRKKLDGEPAAPSGIFEFSPSVDIESQEQSSKDQGTQDSNASKVL